MTHFVIIANGEFQSPDFIREMTAEKTIIALDGAADHLKKLNIHPSIILGDFDSITPETKVVYTNQAEIIYLPDQNKTDLMKAIEYCDTQNANSLTIICALGGRLDHHERTLRALRLYYNTSRSLIIHTHEHSIRFAKDETVHIYGKVGDNCAIMAYPFGSFSSTGLTYDAKDYPLELGFSESDCNSLKTSHAIIEVKGEALIIMPLQMTY